ncbi:MAG: PQQ-binding-like beta-propeller repeat protein [Planctomycetes bacterium]|nr:PQQ-binding-like beta-propeller repeat protein [Planctomycetota bacterium]
MRIVLSVAMALFVTRVAQADDIWPGFRGRGDSVANAIKVPIKWSAKENIAWRIDLPGHGQSSPVVWKDRVFVTAVSGANREKGHVLGIDASTGKKAWSHTFEPTQKAKWTFSVSKAAPTPIVDSDAVYAFFEGGDLLAFSHSGKLLWSRSLVKDYGEFKGNHGLGSSPAQTKDAVVILVDHSGPSYLVAIDKKNGKNRWKTGRKSRGSWASPVIAQRDGKAEIVVSSNGTVAGYDADKGTLLWEMDGILGNTIPSASASGDVIVVGAGISRKGTDSAKAAKSNCCLKLVAKGGKRSFALAWSADRAISSYATPLAYQGHAYFVNQAGVVVCVDLATGKQQYAERIDGPCWASPVGAGGRVYFFGKDGTTTVIKSGPSFVKVASNVLFETDGPGRPGNSASVSGQGDYNLASVLYGVAVVDGAIYVRSGTALYRIGSKQP